MIDCTASLVIYNNPPSMLLAAVESFLSCQLEMHLYVIDNSPTPALRSTFDDLPISYHFCGENVGYGRAHNHAIVNHVPSKYHLVINPDIIISPDALPVLIEFMDNNRDVGIVCCKVLNEDGTIQYLNKRYPTVFDLFVRRFVPKLLHHLFQYRLDHYEMRDVGYDETCDVEFLSGCFMFCRSDVLKNVGGFDPRYFMYFEDCDLSRKVNQYGYRTVYYPYATITHLWERASHKNMKMTWVFIKNMIKYFRKWGWKFY